MQKHVKHLERLQRSTINERIPDFGLCTVFAFHEK